MRKITFITVLLFVVSVISCKKTNSDSTVREKSPQQLMTTNGSQITVYQDMLAFPDWKLFTSTVSSLQTDCDSWDSAFLAMNSSLTDDQLDSLEEQIGYNDDQPLVDFESEFSGFFSLRKDIDQKEDVFLASSNSDKINLDPDNHFVADEVERTLLNSKAEVKVGDTIYMLREDGWVEVYNSDIAIVKEIEKGTIDIVANPSDTVNGQIVYLFIQFKAKCNDAVLHKHKEDFKYNQSNNRRIKWYLGFWNAPWESHRAIAKVKSYKKKNNGNWKKYRSNLFVRVYGTVIADKSNCTILSIDISKPSSAIGGVTPYAHKKKLKAVATINQTMSLKTNMLYGQHIGEGGGIVKNTVLQW